MRHETLLLVQQGMYGVGPIRETCVLALGLKGLNTISSSTAPNQYNSILHLCCIRRFMEPSKENVMLKGLYA